MAGGEDAAVGFEGDVGDFVVSPRRVDGAQQDAVAEGPEAVVERAVGVVDRDAGVALAAFGGAAGDDPSAGANGDAVGRGQPVAGDDRAAAAEVGVERAVGVDAGEGKGGGARDRGRGPGNDDALVGLDGDVERRGADAAEINRKPPVAIGAAGGEGRVEGAVGLVACDRELPAG